MNDERSPTSSPDAAADLPFNGYAQQNIYGDVNGDGVVYISDVNDIISIILEENPNTPAADVNGDIIKKTAILATI